MIANQQLLYEANPVTPMFAQKMRKHGVSHGLAEAGYDIRIKETTWLMPFRRFRLASSMEHFDMPTNLVGIVHDKSTWARQGLSVFNTVIEPGWRGWLTLELVYHGWKPLRIPAGTGIAQVIFHITAEEAGYEGKYQDQPNKAVGAKYE